jgi:hypothetical protein
MIPGTVHIHTDIMIPIIIEDVTAHTGGDTVMECMIHIIIHHIVQDITAVTVPDTQKVFIMKGAVMGAANHVYRTDTAQYDAQVML